MNVGSADIMLNERNHTYSIQVKLETGKMNLGCQAPNGSPSSCYGMHRNKGGAMCSRLRSGRDDLGTLYISHVS